MEFYMLKSKIAVYVFLSLFLLVSVNKPLLAEEKTAETLSLTLKGVVCDFCVGVLRKVFAKRDEVETYSLNLDTKIMTLVLKKDKTLPDDVLTKLVEDAGYNVVLINRRKN
jgi:copper chaperone CopZ